jgi:hypothetical protein
MNPSLKHENHGSAEFHWASVAKRIAFFVCHKKVKGRHHRSDTAPLFDLALPEGDALPVHKFRKRS